MIHIEVTQDDKSLLSFDTEKAVLYQSRALSPLYKTGENKPYTIAPSRFAQTAIYFEEYLDKVEGETTAIKPMKITGVDTITEMNSNGEKS